MSENRARIEDPTAELGTVVDVAGDEVSVTTLHDAGELFGRTPSFYERYVKPTIDFVGAAVLLVLTLPLLLILSLAILVTMGRPVFLKQERVGRYGKVFTLYKLRTMEPDRRTNQVPFVGGDRRRTHKHPEDPRITPLGGFLRVWSLDELPQFVNVLKGEMSLVGPRPEMVEIVARYEPWQHKRHAVKPGLTGMWQVSERGDKALHECTESDIEYLGRLSLGIDLRILLLTPLAALGIRRGH